MQVVIDSVFSADGHHLVLGWLAREDQLDKSQISFNVGGQSAVHQAPFVTYKRADVIKATAYSAEQCAGYMVCLPSEQAELALTYGGKTQVIAFKQANKLTELLIPGQEYLMEQDDISDFIEQLGFVWGQRASGSRSKDFSLNLTHLVDPGYLHIDRCWRLSEHCLLVKGWLYDPAQQVTRLNVKSKQHISNNILESAIRCPRPDVHKDVKDIPHDEKTGFIFTVELETKVPECVSIILGRKGHRLVSKDIAVSFIQDEEVKLTAELLSSITLPETGQTADIEKNLFPALSQLWKSRLTTPATPELVTFGQPSSAAKLSLIIPIYGRYDFVQHQMAQFSIDEDFAHIEVIYILDDPRLRQEFLVTCQGVYEIFGVPFKIVLVEKNLGFAGANNMAVNFASAEHIMLVNSDVMPKQPGGFLTLLSQYKSAPEAGILGAILLYEDDTIQHAGMESVEDPHHPGIWMNYHPNKGFPLSSLPAFEIKESPTVTGALMLLSKSLYMDVGGLDISYILGDFEDSDLCYKIREKGLKIYLSGKVQMYHMERLSQSMVTTHSWKHTLSMLNGLQHSKRWDSKIREIMQHNG